MKNIVILASGSGTNAENITRLFHRGNRIRVAAVLCNRKQAGVYERMTPLGVPVIYMPNSAWDSDPQRVIDTLRLYDTQLIVLAGFMRAVRPEIIEAFGGHVVNIHPSLLPSYGGKGMYGHHVHEAVIAAGETKSGVTVHYVTAEIDGGEIIMQQEVEITPDDTPESLEAKIHPVEYQLYPRAIVKALENLPDLPEQEDKSEADDPAATSQQIASTPPAPSISPDEQWAQTLHITTYSDAGAAAARERLHEQALQRAEAEREAHSVPPPRPAENRPGTASRLIHPTVAQAADQCKELPKSYLWVSIVMALLFSTIPGIIAIVYSASVSSRLSTGDIAGAERASRNAQGWIIASFVIGVLSATLWIPLQLIATAWT